MRDEILGYCDQIDALTTAIRQELLIVPPEPVLPDITWTTVEDGGDLQVALSTGGPIQLAPNATFRGNGYTFETSRTVLVGLGANGILGDGSPAITIPTRLESVAMELIGFAVDNCETGLLVGRNDSQQITIEDAPRGIVFRGVRSSSHRGKRAFEINGADITLADCEVADCFDPENQDSQAVWLGNAPGPLLIEGGYFEAASENFMCGGDQMKIPNCRPTGITVRHAIFTKPLAWKTAGAPKVKNLFELKDGHNVVIEDCEFSNCWQSAQDGYCFMFTPTRGGSVRHVLVKNCTVSNVSGIVNITGVHSDYPNEPRTQVEIQGGAFSTNKADMGGSGRFALLTSGPEYFRVVGASISHQGSSFIEVGDKTPVDELMIVDSAWNYGSYGIRIGGYNHGDNTNGYVRTLTVVGNTISGAHSQFRERYPDNMYTGNMSAKREREIDTSPYCE